MPLYGQMSVTVPREKYTLSPSGAQSPRTLDQAMTPGGFGRKDRRARETPLFIPHLCITCRHFRVYACSRSGSLSKEREVTVPLLQSDIP